MGNSLTRRSNISAKNFFMAILFCVSLIAHNLSFSSMHKAQAAVPASNSCSPLLNLRAVTSTGSNVTGSLTTTMLSPTESDYPYQFEFKGTVSATGLVTICKPTDEQIHDWQIYGQITDPSSSGLIYNRGDLFLISFVNSSTKGVKNQFYSYKLTAANAASLNAGGSITGPDLVVAATPQVGDIAKVGNVSIPGAKIYVDMAWRGTNMEQNIWRAFTGTTSSTGSMSIAGLPEGAYGVEIIPASVPGSSIPLPTYERFTITNGVAAWENSTFPSNTVTVPTGNLSSKIRIQETNGTIRDLTKAEIESLNFSLDGSCTDDGMSADAFRVLGDGHVVAQFPVVRCEYQVSINGDSDPATGIAPTMVQLTSTESGQFSFAGSVSGAIVLKKADIQIRYTNDADLVDAFDNYTIVKQEATGTCRDRLPDDWGQVEVTECTTKYMHLGLNAGLGMFPDLENGSYWFTKAPSGEFGEPAGRTVVSFNISTNSAGKKIISAGDSEFNEGTLLIENNGTRATIKAPSTNINILATDNDGLPVGFARVSSPDSQADEMGKSVTSGISSFDGSVYLNILQAGTFSIDITPQFNLRKVSNARLQVVISGSGNSLSVDRISYNGQNLTKNSQGKFNFKMPPPNFFGKILFPGTSKSASRSMLQWDCLEWDSPIDPHVGAINATDTGDFGASFMPGWCGIAVTPDWNQKKFTDNYYRVWVQDDRGTCIVNQAFIDESSQGDICPEGTLIGASGANLELANPNFMGTIRLNDGNPNTNGQSIRSVKQGAWLFGTLTTLGNSMNSYSYYDSIQDDGEFGFNIIDKGESSIALKYVIQSNDISGYSNFTTYLYGTRDDNGDLVLCQAKTPDSADGPFEFLSNTTPTSMLHLDIEMESSNFILKSIYQPAQNGNATSWGHVTPYESTGNLSWENATYLDSRRSIASGMIGERGQAPKKYQLSMQAYGSEAFAEIKKDIWIGNFDQNSDGLETCFTSVENMSSCPDQSKQFTSGSEIPLTFTRGNVYGTVLGPLETTSANTRVPWSWIEIREFNSSTSSWDWTSLGRNSNEAGKYGLNLPVGLYEIKANDSWSSGNAYAPSKNYVSVTSVGICESDSSGTCASDQMQALDQDLHLTLPNVTGVLTHPDGLKVTGSYVSLYGTDSGANLNSLGGQTVGSSGKFGFSIDSSGDYRLQISPGWEIRSSSANTFIDFTAACTDGVCEVVDADKAKVNDLELSVPNLKGQVCKNSEDPNWQWDCCPI